MPNSDNVIIKQHKVRVEKLFHFNCGYCGKWWTIGDWLPNPFHVLACPSCGRQAEVVKSV